MRHFIGDKFTFNWGETFEREKKGQKTKFLHPKDFRNKFWHVFLIFNIFKEVVLDIKNEIKMTMNRMRQKCIFIYWCVSEFKSAKLFTDHLTEKNLNAWPIPLFISALKKMQQKNFFSTFYSTKIKFRTLMENLL